MIGNLKAFSININAIEDINIIEDSWKSNIQVNLST